MIDFLIILILLCIAGGIILYLYKAKKRGETCIGCPYARQCAKKHAKAKHRAGQPSCSCHNTSTET